MVQKMVQQPVQVMMNTINDTRYQIGIMELASIRHFIKTILDEIFNSTKINSIKIAVLTD